MELPVKQFQTRAEQEYVDLFAAAEQGLPGAGNPWVAQLRAKAIDAYGMLGLPHRRVEAWKYTDLRRLMSDAKPLAVPPDAAAKTRALRAGDLGTERLTELGLGDGGAGHTGERERLGETGAQVGVLPGLDPAVRPRRRRRPRAASSHRSDSGAS